jgi:predicted urease superfamily metal-dependent hydrolase
MRVPVRHGVNVAREYVKDHDAHGLDEPGHQHGVDDFNALRFFASLGTRGRIALYDGDK